MQLTQISPNFFRIVDVFNPAMLSRLQDEFTTTDHWQRLVDTAPGEHIRLQLGLDGEAPLSRAIGQALEPIVTIAEYQLGVDLYQNSPQLWQDPPGYLNTPHKDFSPNLVVNIQVYLGNSKFNNIGTCCFDQDVWHSVPYECNAGYMMFNPTQVDHGMQNPVVDLRRSLYQSYRATEIARDIW